MGRRKIKEKSDQYNRNIAAKIDEEWQQNILDLTKWDDAKAMRVQQLASLDEEEGSGEE